MTLPVCHPLVSNSGIRSAILKGGDLVNDPVLDWYFKTKLTSVGFEENYHIAIINPTDSFLIGPN